MAKKNAKEFAERMTKYFDCVLSGSAILKDLDYRLVDKIEVHVERDFEKVMQRKSIYVRRA